MIAFGANPATHVVNNVYSTPGEALANDPTSYDGWDAFSQRVSGIRNIEGRAVTTVIAEWSPE